MRTHPIPQNVVSFEDRIFGPLTAKQFSIIAAGLSFAFVIFMSPTPEKIKFPLVGLTVVLSFIAGLVKINGMTLDVWLTVFLTAIYSPTQFVWEKNIDTSYLLPKNSDQSTEKQHHTVSPKRILPPELFTRDYQDEVEKTFISQLNFKIPIPKNLPPETFLEPQIADIPTPEISVNEISFPETKEEITEPAFIEELPPEQPISHEEVSTPIVEEISGEEKERTVEPSLIEPEQLITTESPIPIVPTKKTKPKTATQKPLQQRIREVFPTRKQIPSERAGVKTPLASEINFTNKPVYTLNISGQDPQYVQGLSNLRINRAIRRIDKSQIIFPVKGQRKFELSPELEKRFESDEMQIKDLETLSINGEEKSESPTTSPIEEGEGVVSETLEALMEKPEIESVPLQQEILTEPEPPKENLPPVTPELSKLEEEASLPPLPETAPTKSYQTPTLKPKFISNTNEFLPPQIPNVIAGIVRNHEGNTIHNGIILIKDDNDIPVRALKSNRLGQFSIATPLADGHYSVEVEKEGCKFNTYDLELKGELIPLIEIQGTQI